MDCRRGGRSGRGRSGRPRGSPRRNVIAQEPVEQNEQIPAQPILPRNSLQGNNNTDDAGNQQMMNLINNAAFRNSIRRYEGYTENPGW